jgi:hypothetical protein
MLELGDTSKPPTNPTADDFTFKGNPQLYLEALGGLAMVHWQCGETDQADTLYKELLTRTLSILRAYYMRATPRPTSETEDEILSGSSDSSLPGLDRYFKHTIQNQYVHYLEQAAEFYRSVKKTDEAENLKSRADHAVTLIGGKKTSELPWPF